jgi:hypothetical protein
MAVALPGGDRVGVVVANRGVEPRVADLSADASRRIGAGNLAVAIGVGYDLDELAVPEHAEWRAGHTGGILVLKGGQVSGGSHGLTPLAGTEACAPFTSRDSVLALGHHVPGLPGDGRTGRRVIRIEGFIDRKPAIWLLVNDTHTAQRLNVLVQRRGTIR